MIHERLIEIRKKLGLTQDFLAEKLAVSPRCISQYERGQRKISIDYMLFLLDQYDINLNYLIGGKGEMFNNNESEIALKTSIENVLKEHGLI